MSALVWYATAIYAASTVAIAAYVWREWRPRLDPAIEAQIDAIWPAWDEEIERMAAERFAADVLGDIVDLPGPKNRRAES